MSTGKVWRLAGVVSEVSQLTGIVAEVQSRKDEQLWYYLD
jgi:hypothetical protein